MTALAIDRLGVEIGSVPVCHELSVMFKPGQVWSILGPNGVGKTTLLRTLAGLHRPYAGAVRLNERIISDVPRRLRARQLGILFQQHTDVFPLTVIETVLTGRHPWCSPLQGETASDLKRVRHILADVGLENCHDRNVLSLSGGERRRVDLAALAAQDPQVFLLDEPSNHLDLRHQLTMFAEMVRRWQVADRLVVMVLHDINLALRLSDHLLFLYGAGKCSFGTTRDMATEDKLSKLYDQPMQHCRVGQRDLFFAL